MAVDTVRADTGQAKAITAMKKYDPEFKFEDMHFEAEEVFKEFYCNFLDGNKEYIKKVSSSEAIIVQALIELREQEGWAYKYPEILDCGRPEFIGAKMVEGIPAFTFTIDVQEFDAKINVKTGEPWIPTVQTTEDFAT
jgi:hypothetical protein